MPDEPEVHGLLRADAAARRAPRRAVRRRRAGAARRPGPLALGRRADRDGPRGARPRARAAAAAAPTCCRRRSPSLHAGRAARLGARSPRSTASSPALTGSPVVELNRAVAVAEAEGAEAGARDRRRARPRRLPLPPRDARRAAAAARPPGRGARRLRARARARACSRPSGASCGGASQKSPERRRLAFSGRVVSIEIGYTPGHGEQRRDPVARGCNRRGFDAGRGRARTRRAAARVHRRRAERRLATPDPNCSST